MIKVENYGRQSAPPYSCCLIASIRDSKTSAINILRGKTAVFLGDSICAGTTTLSDAAEYGYGWGGIIGEANGMIWKNYGRNGGTITPIESVDSARWVPTQVNLALVGYPNGYKMDSTDTTVYIWKTLFDRTVLKNPITVPANGTATLDYAISFKQR